MLYISCLKVLQVPDNTLNIMEEYGAYLVIKILSPNRNDLLKEYECVPKSWVKVKDHYDNYVVFAYPLEDRLDTRLRVIENQSLDSKWPILYGEVVFNTDSQKEAFRFLERNMHERESDSDQSKDTREQDEEEVETTTSNKIRIKPIKLSSKQTNRPYNRKQSDQENILQNNKIQNEPEKGLGLIFLEADELIRTYATDVDNEETVSSSTSNNLHNIQIPDTTQILQNETDNVTEETPVNKENAEKITARPRRQSTRHLSQDPQPLLQERTSRETSSDGNCSDGSCNDENTKWTVRYPEPGPGIIELLPHSGVYVSEKGLNECKSTNSETTKFTRALLEEVFTDKALKKCSFTGTSRKNVKNVKPPLDLKAREIFVEYVLQYSREMSWKKADPDIIMTCIRNRLSSLHRIG